ncbi:cylicin-1 [Lingula anatina]|uniref:Cylicin-1 n=1 Tax=Lingula anatina TaxID=7574 RepID=A0A1S3HZV4_LINAN|nr:cylicin-1 [Lingula anatina]|eukprot:XP_013391547.1 cylicin-1 [Lingula anatina]
MAAPMEHDRSKVSPEYDSNTAIGLNAPGATVDFTSSEFDPLIALYSDSTVVPDKNVNPFNNLAEFDSVSNKKRQAQPGKARLLREANAQRILKLQLQSQSKIRQSESTDKPEDEDQAENRRRVDRNVLSRMEDEHHKGPFSLLRRCVKERKKVKVLTRSFKHVRGICSGYVIAFDTHFNLAMQDVDEVYAKPWKRRKKRKRHEKVRKEPTANVNGGVSGTVENNLKENTGNSSSQIIQVHGNKNKEEIYPDENQIDKTTNNETQVKDAEKPKSVKPYDNIVGLDDCESAVKDNIDDDADSESESDDEDVGALTSRLAELQHELAYLAEAEMKSESESNVEDVPKEVIKLEEGELSEGEILDDPDNDEKDVKGAAKSDQKVKKDEPSKHSHHKPGYDKEEKKHGESSSKHHARKQNNEKKHDRKHHRDTLDKRKDAHKSSSSSKTSSKNRDSRRQSSSLPRQPKMEVKSGHKEGLPRRASSETRLGKKMEIKDTKSHGNKDKMKEKKIVTVKNPKGKAPQSQEGEAGARTIPSSQGNSCVYITRHVNQLFIRGDSVVLIAVDN